MSAPREEHALRAWFANCTLILKSNGGWDYKSSFPDAEFRWFTFRKRRCSYSCWWRRFRQASSIDWAQWRDGRTVETLPACFAWKYKAFVWRVSLLHLTLILPAAPKKAVPWCLDLLSCCRHCQRKYKQIKATGASIKRYAGAPATAENAAANYHLAGAKKWRQEIRPNLLEFDGAMQSQGIWLAMPRSSS